jgi:DNA polymerase-2
VLKPIVEKRAQYKEMIKEGHPKSAIFQRRREAFKWALVTCFGYLGFRNARFGRIEAHECVNAYSREVLLKAKEVAEAEGYHFVHAIVASLWLKKPGATAEEVEALRKKIEEATGLPLGYEGRYRWIRFCPSRINARVGVPNRYFGTFSTGELKLRGIELRRHDTPLFIKELQQKLLDRMATAKNLKELKSLEDDLTEIVEEAEDRLQNGQISPFDLAVSVHLRQEPDRYQHDTLSAIAAKKLAASGVKLHPGETIQYVVMEEHDKVKDWRVMPLALIAETFEYDRKYYQRHLERAVKSIWEPTLRRARALSSS